MSKSFCRALFSVAVLLASFTSAAAQYLDPGRAWTERDAQGRRIGAVEPRAGGGYVLRVRKGDAAPRWNPDPAARTSNVMRKGVGQGLLSRVQEGRGSNGIRKGDALALGSRID